MARSRAVGASSTWMAERAIERQAGLEQRGELLGEGHQIAAGDAAAAQLRPRQPEQAARPALRGDP